MEDGTFIIFYVKNNQMYPVMITKEQHELIQMFIPNILGKNIQVFDKPQGTVEILNKDNH
jgi:hypothetical protein